MLLVDCPWWEYDDHPKSKIILPTKCTEWLVLLRSGALKPKELSCDTRAAHEYIFNELTPTECEYFAGHYRGEKYLCLEFCSVQIPSDPRVGTAPAAVMSTMEQLKETIESGMAVIDEAYKVPNAQLPQWQKILYLVTFSTKILVEFLRIHPYANGNGHMARFIIFTLLAQHDIWPKKWPFEESPPYYDLISDYRDGNSQPLEDFILKSILGN